MIFISATSTDKSNIETFYVTGKVDSQSEERISVTIDYNELSEDDKLVYDQVLSAISNSVSYSIENTLSELDFDRVTSGTLLKTPVTVDWTEKTEQEKEVFNDFLQLVIRKFEESEPEESEPEESLNVNFFNSLGNG